MPKASSVQRQRMARAWTKPDGLHCLYCGRLLRLRKKGGARAAPRVTVDHLIPFAHPLGSNHPVNRVPACFDCNGRKGDRDPVEFLLTFPPSERGVPAEVLLDLVANAAIAAIRDDLNACL